MRVLFDSPFWGRGFRPFFFLGALHSVVSLALWAGFYNGSVELPETSLDPIAWHAHEMIFGFCMAIVSGFLLTAVANWTGWLPVRQAHLALLTGLWLVGRITVSIDLGIPSWAIIVLEGMFIPLLTLSLAIPLLKSWNARNFIFLGLLTGLFLCDLFFLVTGKMAFLHTALMVVLIIVSLVGGRIIPAFTVATLRRNGKLVFQTDQRRLDATAILSLFAVAALLVFMPGTVYLSMAAFLSAGLHGLRMRHYHVFKALFDPMLWILHAGFGWLVVGLFLLGLSGIGLVMFSTALHALTVGCIGSMILGMMCRVTLGHTGRDMKADALTVLGFVVMQGVVILRVLGPWLMPAYMTQWIVISATLWALCFAIYLYVYGGMLFVPRPDGEEA